MWKKWKESEFFRKLKQIRINRAIYLTALVILLSLAIVLAITAVANRAKKSNLPKEPGTTDAAEQPTDEPKTDEKKDDKTDAETANKLPEFALPVSGRLTQTHSVDVQVFSKTLKDYRVHLGIDIGTAESAPVCAAAAGTVSQIWEDPMMGWCVALSHSGDCVTVYKNLAKDMAEGLNIGSTVQKGELLGYVGDSAMMEIAEEPHLHMEMTVGGLQVNPLEYFNAAVVSALSEDDVYEDEAGK